MGRDSARRISLTSDVFSGARSVSQIKMNCYRWSSLKLFSILLLQVLDIDDYKVWAFIPMVIRRKYSSGFGIEVVANNKIYPNRFCKQMQLGSYLYSQGWKDILTLSTTSLDETNPGRYVHIQHRHASISVTFEDRYEWITLSSCHF